MIPDASSFLDAPAWLLTLVDAASRVTLLLVTAGVLAFFLQRAAANVRHFIWHLAIVSCLLVPLATVVLPRLEWKVLPTREPSLEQTTPALDAPARSSSLRRSQWAAWSDLNTMPDVPSGWTRAPFADDPAPKPETVSGFSLPKLRLDQWLLLVWLAGVIVVLEWVVVDRVRVFFLAQRSRDVSDARRDVFLQQVLRLGVEGPVRFVEADIELPMTWGVVDATVAVPLSSREWPEERLEAVLLHELAHVRRRDTFTQLLAQLACALYWFHPMVWFAARQLRVLREYACDDEVLNHGVRPSSYAEELLQLVENVRRRDRLSGATLGMARRSHFKERLLAMLDPSVPRARLGRQRAWSMAALALIFTASLVVVQPAAAESPPAPATLPRLTPKQSAQRQVTAPPEALAPADPAPAPRLPRLAPPAPPQPAEPAIELVTEDCDASGDEAAVRAKIDAAVRAAKDDASLATALKRIAHEEELDEEATRQAFLKATARLNDDLARWVALEALLIGAPISEQTGKGIMKEAFRFSRDAERIAFLHRMHTIREDELVRGPLSMQYLDLAAKLQSQEALSTALRELLHPSPVEPKAVERALMMASSLDGDLIAPVLIEVTDHQAIAGNLPALYKALTRKLEGEKLRDALERYEDAVADNGKLWTKFAWNDARVKVNVRDYQRQVQEAAREAAREAREAAREAREEALEAAQEAREKAQEAREEALRQAAEAREEALRNAREAREDALRQAEELRREADGRREQAREYARQLEQLRREKAKLKERAEQLKNEALELDSAMKQLQKNLKGAPDLDVDVDVDVE